LQKGYLTYANQKKSHPRQIALAQIPLPLSELLLPIPGEILRINPRTRQIRQPPFSQIEFQEIPHQRLDRIFGFDFDFVDAALESF
jgi:hypothetical protein